jgi:hypothetical protein
MLIETGYAKLKELMDGYIKAAGSLLAAVSERLPTEVKG